jgi:hypothetical protein
MSFLFIYCICLMYCFGVFIGTSSPMLNAYSTQLTQRNELTRMPPQKEHRDTSVKGNDKMMRTVPLQYNETAI